MKREKQRRVLARSQGTLWMSSSDWRGSQNGKEAKQGVDKAREENYVIVWDAFQLGDSLEMLQQDNWDWLPAICE